MSHDVSTRQSTVFEAWRFIGQALLVPGVEQLIGCTVTVVESGAAGADGDTRARLDALLERKGAHDCRAVAKATFPFIDRPTRTYADVMDSFGRIRRVYRNRPSKTRRSYFARMIDVPADETNQLEKLINVVNAGNHRGSALVLTAWNPGSDLNTQRRSGFPCLNSIHVRVSGNVLDVRGIYPLQYMVPKLYGNLLGMQALGRFLAFNTGKTLGTFSCYASVEQIGSGFTKADLRQLVGLNT